MRTIRLRQQIIFTPSKHRSTFPASVRMLARSRRTPSSARPAAPIRLHETEAGCFGVRTLFSHNPRQRFQIVIFGDQGRQKSELLGASRDMTMKTRRILQGVTRKVLFQQRRSAILQNRAITGVCNNHQFFFARASCSHRYRTKKV